MKKKPRSFKRLVLGDIIEIPLSDGRLAYAQYIFNHREAPVWGHLIRILPGLFTSPPDSYSDLAREKHRFCAFFPAGAALSRGLVKVVSEEAIPIDCRELPLFRACNRNSQSGRKTWYLCYPEGDQQVLNPAPEFYDLPLMEIVSFDVLVERIESDWSPRDEV